MPLCRKWMPRGDGLEMRSAISTTVSSSHYLHLYKFWRYLGEYNYLWVPRAVPPRLHHSVDICIDDIISGCSSNFSRKSHQRELFETSYGIFVLVNLFNHPISITFNQFLTLISSFLRKVHLFGDQMATHSLMLPYLPHMFYSRFYFLVTLNCVVRAVHACSCQVFTSWLIWLASSTRLQRFEIVRHRRTNYSFV